ncbi:MAG TPA: NUDIX hydrolase [Desulfobacteria bacterium]|nr:NUDIX hydrolase [Desulfobacteria bacterium]
MANKWKTLNSQIKFSSPFLKLVADHCAHQENGTNHTFYRLELRDWVNIVPITPQGEVIMVRQYRWGCGCETLEVPGGTLDSLEEQPLAGVKRELKEETGFDCDEIVHLGSVAVNPAMQDNHCHFFLALNVDRQGEQELDETEDISLELIPLDKIIPLILDGTIRHSLAIQSLLYALLSLGKTANWPQLNFTGQL